MSDIKGKIHSFETLGTLDGPGVRFIAFMQGCPLRCGCCHNPDTWQLDGAQEYTPQEVFEKARRFKPYFGAQGGLTLSGGEPLLQPEFGERLFSLCRQNKITTCLDTSGCVLNDEVLKLLDYTDTVLLDIKYTNEADYKRYTGGSLAKTLDFLRVLNEKGIDTWLRQVIISGKNDSDENIRLLAEISAAHTCVKKTQLLAFHKMCEEKYERLAVPFPFKDIEPTSAKRLQQLQQKIDTILNNLK